MREFQKSQSRFTGWFGLVAWFLGAVCLLLIGAGLIGGIIQGAPWPILAWAVFFEIVVGVTLAATFYQWWETRPATGSLWRSIMLGEFVRDLRGEARRRREEEANDYE